jgi:hypothetical protein
MDEIELKILKMVYGFRNPPALGVSSEQIACDLAIDHQDSKDFLDMLCEQGYLKLKKYIDGTYGTCLTHKGRLLLTHPDYMLNKGYGDASDVLKALEKVINDSTEIPLPKRISLSSKIKELSHDPYIQNISSGLIVEALKKVVGI